MLKVRVTEYAGGELEIATSRVSVGSLGGDIGGDDPETLAVPTPASLSPGGDSQTSTPALPSPSSLLDYSSQLETASRARLSGYGAESLRKTKFTRQASKTIQRCARALDGFVDSPGDILFLTGTLPGTGKEQYKCIGEWSSYIVHRLKAWVAKHVPGKMDFYCWELQKRGALHLHYAVHCPDKSAAAAILLGFKAQWVRLLQAVSDRTGTNLFLNTETGQNWLEMPEAIQAKAERVEKSVGAYLGKYLSKSSRGTNAIGQFAPCRWYGVSRPLRELEKSLRVTHEEFLLNKGKAISFAECVLHYAGLFSDVCYAWDNKFGDGKGGRVFGLVATGLSTILSIVKDKRMTTESPSLKVFNAYAALHECISYSKSTNPAWWEGFDRAHGKFGWLTAHMSQSHETIKSPSGLCAFQSLVWNLEESLRCNSIYNGFYLDFRWRNALSACLDNAQVALRSAYASEYSYEKYEDFASLIEIEPVEHIPPSGGWLNRRSYQPEYPPLP